MNGKTFLSFDFGEKRIGVAVGSDITESANALTTLNVTNDDERFGAIAPLVKDWQPYAFIVGHPTHPDGNPHAMTARAEKFARQLEGRFSRKVFLVDERFSSVEAEISFKARTGKKVISKDAIDAEAAANILRRYFESGAHRDEANA